MTNEYYVPEKSSNPALSGRVADNKPLIIVIISAVVLLLFFALVIFLLGINEVTTATIRDIAVILLALSSLLINFVLLVLVIILVYLIMKVNDLVQLLNTEVKPVLERANETAMLARDTAQDVQTRVNFVGSEVVKPVISFISSLYAIRTIFKTLFSR